MSRTHTHRLINTRGAKESVLASTCDLADSFISRSKGLLGRSSFPAGNGLWIKRCNSIHTFFMRFPIDALFVDENLKVVSIYQGLKPWRITRLHLKASSVFELPAGTVVENQNIAIGDVLKLEAIEGGEDGR